MQSFLFDLSRKVTLYEASRSQICRALNTTPQSHKIALEPLLPITIRLMNRRTHILNLIYAEKSTPVSYSPSVSKNWLTSFEASQGTLIPKFGRHAVLWYVFRFFPPFCENDNNLNLNLVRIIKHLSMVLSRSNYICKNPGFWKQYNIGETAPTTTLSPPNAHES